MWFTGTLHGHNGFYTVQTICTIALHVNLALTGDFVHFLLKKPHHLVCFLSLLVSRGHRQCPHKPPSCYYTDLILINHIYQFSHTHTHTHTQCRLSTVDWRQKWVQPEPGTSKVYPIKWPVSVYRYIQYLKYYIKMINYKVWSVV